MKKTGYCRNCNYEFDYIVNSMDDLNNVFCPRCNNRIKVKERKIVQQSKFEKSVGKVCHGIFDFWYYFYLIFSIIGLLSFYLGFKKLLIIASFITLLVYFIELLIGFTRNILGFFGLILSSLIGMFIAKDLLIGICIGSSCLFFISGIIRCVFDLIIKKLFEKYG